MVRKTNHSCIFTTTPANIVFQPHPSNANNTLLDFVLAIYTDLVLLPLGRDDHL